MFKSSVHGIARSSWRFLQTIQNNVGGPSTRLLAKTLNFESCFSSVQFSHSVVSDSFWPHRLQHARPPCPSPSPRVCPNARASSQWCHPTVSSPVIPFSSCLSLPQHQGLFQWIDSSHQVATVLELQLQHRLLRVIAIFADNCGFVYLSLHFYQILPQVSYCEIL